MRTDNTKERVLMKMEELLRPLTKLSKNWQEHLSEHLDEYMECLNELSRYDDFGLAAINFVKAGVMIEGTTKMYAVNVDCLWQFMNQVLEVMRMNKAAEESRRESERSPEASGSSEEEPRRRKKRAQFTDFEEFVPKVIDPDRKSIDRTDSVKLLPVRLNIAEKTDWKRRKRSYEIFDMDGDTLVPSDYRVMCQTSSQGKLQVNMLRDLMNHASEENAESNHQENVNGMIHFLERLLRELTGDSTNADDEESDDGTPLLLDEEILNPPSVGAQSDAPTEPVEHVPPPLPATPPPSPASIKRSTSESTTPVPIKRSVSDFESEGEVCAGGLTSGRAREKEHLVTVTTDPWQPIPLEGGIPDRPLKRRQTFKLPCDIKLLKPEEKKRKVSQDTKIMVEYFLEAPSNKYSYFPIDSEFRMFFDEEAKKKRTLIQAQSALSIYTDIEVLQSRLERECEGDFCGFEDYEPEAGEETGFCGFPDEQEAEEEEEEDDIEVDDNGDGDVIPLQTDEILSRPGSSKDLPVQSNFFGVMDDDDVVNVSEEMVIAKRVSEWEKYIRPKLKVAHDRGHFDIHGIGTEILNAFPQNCDRQTLQFRDLVADKSTVDVPRYFLAALQLANTYNIEISEPRRDGLCMDVMQMTLLSSARHHETLEDYEAPSDRAKRKSLLRRFARDSSDSDSDRSSRSTPRRKRNKR